MSYEKLVSRAAPGLINVVLDDSGSMSDNLPGTSDPKYKWVERYFGIILQELLARSNDVRGDTVVVKPRYYVHTILYGSHPQLWGSEEMDIETTVEKYTQEGNSLGLGGKLGGTDAEAAHRQAYEYLQKAVADEKFTHSFPPMLFHLTDSMSSTDASAIAEQIKQLSTSDGNVLMVNAFIGTQTNLNYQGPEDFPGYCDVDEAGPSDDNIRMFNMSSEVPESIRMYLIENGIFPKLREGARLFFDVRTKEMLKHVIQVVSSIGSQAEREAR